MKQPRLPNRKQRLTIVGRTGTGKTVAAVWHLSQQPLDVMPWVVYDFKTDELINKIERAQHVDLDFIPSRKDTGVFIVHPMPGEVEAVTRHLWRLWERRNVGIYIDEGYMMGQDNDALNAIYTQGRSMRIPMITLSQRPVWMSRFAFSEADFFQIFALNDKRDQKTIESFAPVNLAARIPEYHSYYYDVGRNNLTMFKPVPSEDVILATLQSKLKKGRRRI
jgi:hypothetical protein